MNSCGVLAVKKVLLKPSEGNVLKMGVFNDVTNMNILLFDGLSPPPAVNFINILRVCFFVRKFVQNQTLSREKTIVQKNRV
jgi:hypothetical protein